MIALLGTGIIISSILVTPDAYARQSENQRYSDGFNDVIQAAITDRQNGNPFNQATKTVVPEMGYYSVCLDTENNSFILT